MMEKVSCFIRKNTPELRKRIEDLGIHLCCCASFNSSIWLDYNSEASLMVHGAPLYNEGNEEQNIACYLKNTEEWGTIDCGENEDMFLALIALSDDTDMNQWFIYDSRDCVVTDLRELAWYKCDEHDYKDYFFYNCAYLNARKATAKEIVEHFKIK